MFPIAAIAEAATAAVEISRVSALVGSSPSNAIQDRGDVDTHCDGQQLERKA